jgi:hypothetical protein
LLSEFCKVEELQPLWEQLESLQLSSMDRLSGLFPSFRWHPWGYRREDHSAYFTATLMHSLLRLENFLQPEEARRLEAIRQRACAGLEPFQNKQGLPRYNFWKTNPPGHFPNGRWFNRIESLRPPDDADDSVMIYQLQKRSNEEAIWLKEHIDSYANGSRKWVMNAEPDYKNLRAYSTFFAKDMPLGFDACVIANILYFNRLYGFEENFKEQDSVAYLVKMLRRKDHIRKPGRVSPYYPETTTILYHLAKLMSRFSIPALNERVWHVESDLEEYLKKPLGATERLMVESAWMWLSRKLPPEGQPENARKPFAFFVLPLSLEYPGKFAGWLAEKPFSHIRFGCPALELAMRLENRILRRALT